MERDRLYAVQAERDPAFATYQQNTDRVIAVVALTPARVGAATAPGRWRVISPLARYNPAAGKEPATDALSNQLAALAPDGAMSSCGRTASR